MEQLLQRIEELIWGWPLLVLLLGAGCYLQLRLRFLPLRRLPLAMRLLFRRRERGEGVSAFGALCAALSATVGTGNIVGVATALTLGGPGALLWMELSALTGLSLQYAEGLLAVRYRKRDAAGRAYGGPFAYLSLGLGPRFRWLANAFACFGALAGLCGVGSFVQVGSVTACLSALLNRSLGGLTVLSLPFGGSVSLAGLLVGLVMACCAARVMRGGMGGLSRLSAVLVPFMGGLYVLLCLWILGRNYTALPAVLGRIWESAFSGSAVGGGLLATVMAGVSRGVFSNEAGVGTAPIAAAAAEGVRPAEQGLISMTATIFDTFLICTLTGLVLLVTGAEGGGLSGALEAFGRGLPLPDLLSGALLVTVLALFSFTTVVGWSCYGTACLDHLTGGTALPRRIYLAIYVLTVALAPFCSARGIWMAANVCNGLMALPNLIGLLLLSPRVAESSRVLLDFPQKIRYNSCQHREKRGEAHAGAIDRCGPRGRGHSSLRR